MAWPPANGSTVETLESTDLETPATVGLDEIRRTARERFGISRLYREQERAISSVLSGRDTLLVMPTGGGKALCYQLPSLLLPQPTVVVSPLLALLEDQYLKMQQFGVPTVRLDSTVGVADRREGLARIAKGGPLLILTTPETLAGNELGRLLEIVPPALVAVDEAHCISEWGHDFRPAYLALGQRLQQLQTGRILGLTATATPPVRDDIVRYRRCASRRSSSRHRIVRISSSRCGAPAVTRSCASSPSSPAVCRARASCTAPPPSRSRTCGSGSA